MRLLAFTTGAVLLCVATAGAQPAARKEPAQYVATERTSRVEVRPPGIRLALGKPRELALAPLSDSQLAQLATPGPRLKTGLHRSLPADALSTGAWEIAPDGTRIWRMAFRSPGAVAMRVEFRNFSVGAGSVWLDDGTAWVGPYTGRGIFDDGRFWSGSVFSDSMVLEYAPDPARPEEATPPFEVRTLSHVARLSRRGPIRSSGGSAIGKVSEDPAAGCNLDASCYPEWKSTMSMVAEMRFEEDDGEYACTGSAIATRDNTLKPYFLTAGHCISSEDVARTLQAYWTYQTAACHGAVPDISTSTKSTLGAHLVDWGTMEQGDYSLLLLKDVPSGVQFSGWDTAVPPVSSAVVGIHHPKGSYKRISFGNRVNDETVNVDGDIAPADKFLVVEWTDGVAEPGSSGSPLFTSPGVIVGTLTYGPSSPSVSACDIIPMDVGYGRFANAYAALKGYLENYPAVYVLPDKSALSFNVSGHTSPAGQTVKLTTQSSGQIAWKLRADAPWLQVSTVTGTVSANSPAQVTVTVDGSKFDHPDQYAGTVTILSGTADPQYINVTAKVTMTQSNVVAAISPNPVVQSGGLWSFKVRLGETAGAPTRVTALKLNGTDYSANIKDWFGTDHIDAKGAIEAPLSGTGRFPAGDQYFEFWGIDDAGGQRWYRVVTVTFQ